MLSPTPAPLLPLLLAATATLVASDAGLGGLRDVPVAGDAVTYLDNRNTDAGLSWTASADVVQHGAAAAGCTFTADTDLDHAGPLVDQLAAASQDDCCQACYDHNACFGAVFYQKVCYLKGKASVAKPQSSHGRVACVPHSLPHTTQVSIPATVPGDLISDLHAAGQIGDPLYEMNFKNSSIWHDNIWTYTTQFSLDDLPGGGGGGGEILLVFDGIKMGANISVNGVKLGEAVDQFLRYSFPLAASGALAAGSEMSTHTLTVSFDSSACIGGRFMACTGGWDWAPYTTTKDPDTGANTFTKGIWKSVYLVRVSSAAITHVVPQVRYKGAYPVERLVEGKHGGFEVGVNVHLQAGAASVHGSVAVSGAWGASDNQTVSLKGGEEAVVALRLDASASDIKLWWPVGLGNQPLYSIKVTWTPAATPTASVETVRRVGFRFFALVTGNDTNPAYVKSSADADGTSDQGMFWRINGAPIWSRGANVIPMEELEARMSGPAHTQMVASAVGAGMNTVRVWGGGMFLPRAFYDACDENGIMVYHDMQYAQQGHSPKATRAQDAELRHNIRRLSSHPSIVMWDGCNECQVKMGTDTEIYATFVMTVVAQEDKSRSVWPSCPALGWSGGVSRLTSIPNGKNLTTPDSGNKLETHGPYQVSRLPTGKPSHTLCLLHDASTFLISRPALSPPLPSRSTVLDFRPSTGRAPCSLSTRTFPSTCPRPTRQACPRASSTRMSSRQSSGASSCPPLRACRPHSTPPTGGCTAVRHPTTALMGFPASAVGTTSWHNAIIPATLLWTPTLPRTLATLRPSAKLRSSASCTTACWGRRSK